MAIASKPYIRPWTAVHYTGPTGRLPEAHGTATGSVARIRVRGLHGHGVHPYQLEVQCGADDAEHGFQTLCSLSLSTFPLLTSSSAFSTPCPTSTSTAANRGASSHYRVLLPSSCSPHSRSTTPTYSPPIASAAHDGRKNMYFKAVDRKLFLYCHLLVLTHRTPGFGKGSSFIAYLSGPLCTSRSLRLRLPRALVTCRCTCTTECCCERAAPRRDVRPAFGYTLRAPRSDALS